MDQKRLFLAIVISIAILLGFQVLIARTEVGGYCSHCQTLRAREVEEIRQLPAAAQGAAAKTPRGAARARRS